MVRAVGYSGGSVVDYGCGTGDLCGYLTSLGTRFSYLGLDMNPGMLERARRTYSFEFAQIEPDETDFPRADYVFASGIFQFRDRDDPDYHVRLLGKLFDRCDVGLAVTFLSAAREEAQMRPDELYMTASAVAERAAALSGRWVLDHSYHPGNGDMTLAIMASRPAEPWRRP
jgi:trans-aconitate methyltransferase